MRLRFSTLTSIPALILSLGTTSMAVAQAVSGTIPDASVLTLHSYSNLEQVPVLVLTPQHERMKPINGSRFRLQLDAGSAFAPAHVRRESDEPLSLAILVDLTKPSPLLPEVGDAVASLVSTRLYPGDHLSLWVMGCTLQRLGNDQTSPEAQAALLNRRLAELPPACRHNAPLWDAVGGVVGDLNHHPGWRVLLVLTDGHDEGSHATWKLLRDRAQTSSVAIFGLWTADPVVGPIVMGSQGAVFTQDPFEFLCETTGGVQLSANRKTLSNRLTLFADIVRERYILDYPRRNEDRPGRHSITVTILKSDAYIRPAGILVPLADPRTLADPTTVQTTRKP